MINIEIKTENLSDGSKAYQVALTKNNLTIYLPATSEEDAYRLAYALKNAIHDFTADLVCLL